MRGEGALATTTKKDRGARGHGGGRGGSATAAGPEAAAAGAKATTTNTTTKDKASAAAVVVRGCPGPFEPASVPVTDAGAGAKAATTDTKTIDTTTAATEGVRGGQSPLEPPPCPCTRYVPDVGREAAAAGGEVAMAYTATTETTTVSWTPALCHHGRSGYQPFPLVPNPNGVWPAQRNVYRSPLVELANTTNSVKSILK
jgi:hypothetical protein